MSEDTAVGSVGGPLGELVIPLEAAGAVVLAVGVVEVDGSLGVAAGGRDGLGLGLRGLGRLLGLGGGLRLRLGLRGLNDGLGGRRGDRGLSGLGLLDSGGSSGGGRRRRRRGGGLRGSLGLGSRRGRRGGSGLGGLDKVGRLSGDSDGDDLGLPLGVGLGGGGKGRAGDESNGGGLHIVKGQWRMRNLEKLVRGKSSGGDHEMARS